MAEKITIARPYAQAIFDVARKEGALARWSEVLELLATVVSDSRIGALIGNPHVSREQLVKLVLDICGDALGDTARSLVRVLAESRRLDLLPDMGRHYEQYRAEAEKTVDAEVITAFPLTGEQQSRIASALKRRLGLEVHLKCTTDGTLIGGAVIRAGDMVIDGSVTGQVDRLASALSR